MEIKTKNNFFLKFTSLLSSLLNQKDYFLSKFFKPPILKEYDYESLFYNNCKKFLDKNFLYIRIFHLLAYTVFGLRKTTLETNEKYHAKEIKNISTKSLQNLNKY